MRVDKLKLPGKEGGCAAVEIAMEDVLAGVQREVTQQPVDEGDRMADLKGFLKAVLKVRNHKAFPPGSVPAELLKAVLFSSWLHRDRSKPGVGAPTMQATLSKLSSFPVRDCVMKIFRMIRSTEAFCRGVRQRCHSHTLRGRFVASPDEDEKRQFCSNS